MSAHIARPIAPNDLFRRASAATRPDPWDRDLYEEWADRLGADRMRFFLLKLRDQLRDLRILLVEQGTLARDALHRMAHDVSSTSGMLGFMEVTRGCRTLLEAASPAEESRSRPELGDALERAIFRLDQHLSADDPRAVVRASKIENAA